jgi:glycosyltransferase involved in cell wall biosynthesis
MRIAQISTVATPVLPSRAGSIETLVYLLSQEFVNMGHEVTVYAMAGSTPAGELVATLPGPYGHHGAPDNWHVCEWINLCRAIEDSGRFDVIHAHAYLWGLPLAPLSSAPMIHTLHVMPHTNEARLRAMHPEACVTAISRYQWSEFPEHQPANVVYHGIDPSQFTFTAEPDEYLCYLGRFMPEKGVLHAISTARSLEIPLLIAGPENNYFNQHVRPHIDGRTIEYVGRASAAERDTLLRGAKALLYPIQAPEPFGLVLIEAMMCGTPVAAFGIGAVSEIVDEGITGHCVMGIDEFPSAVLNTLSLDRHRVRNHAERRFTAERMAREYAQVYESILVGEARR